MADISQYLQAIMSAVYGEEVRGSIHDAIEIINDVSEVVLTTGTAVTNPTSSSTGFFTNSLYLNTNTMELWKCIGTDLWSSLGTLKGDQGDNGADGNGIVDIVKTSTVGLVDTYTINYTDGGSDDFTVTNGADGANGNKWYRGTAISGKSVNPTVYSGSGITNANPNDYYLNPTEGAIYYCVLGGDANTATWSYDFTMTGGGGGGGTSDYNELTNKPSIAGTTLSGNKTLADLGAVAAADLATVATSGEYSDLNGTPTLAEVATSGLYNDLSNKPTIPTVDQTYNASSANAQSGIAVASAISRKQDTISGGNGITVSENVIYNDGVLSMSVEDYGTASSSGTSIQRISRTVRNGTNISTAISNINRTRYMQISSTSGTSYTFSNGAITSSSVIDVYTDTYGDNPSNVVATSGSCTVTFATSKTRTVRIYIQ